MVYAGILTILVGFTGDPYEKLMKTMEGLRNNLHNALDHIEREVAAKVLDQRLTW